MKSHDRLLAVAVAVVVEYGNGLILWVQRSELIVSVRRVLIGEQRGRSIRDQEIQPDVSLDAISKVPWSPVVWVA